VKDPKGALPLLKKELTNLNSKWLSSCQLTLDPSYSIKGIDVEKCKIMDSKMKPLWLCFQNAIPGGDPILIIFKCGDDLRQDLLTLQMFRIMDKMWKKEGLDLKLNPYGVIPTGAETGMVEIVTSSNTVSKIQKEMAGGAIGAFSNSVIFEWLLKWNTDDMAIKLAAENFTRSCAGYCVATYVLGIGDRHNDNIMVKKDGHLFHIDFGHILGNFKKKYGFKRERVPFVFTPDWEYVMDQGAKEKDKLFNQFLRDCVQSHHILKTHGRLFVNLFNMMLNSGMPELQTKADIRYVVETLDLEVMPGGKEITMADLVAQTGTQFSTRVNFFIHNLVH